MKVVQTDGLVFREQGSSGRRSKVRLVPVGPFHYRGEEMELSADDLREIASETRRLIYNCQKYADEGQTPWTPPVIREHRPDGTRDGDVVDVELVDDRELFGSIQWRESTWEQILSDEVEFVSVHIRPDYTDMAGELYSWIVWEVSLTTHPVRKDIGRIQDTISLSFGERAFDVDLAEGDKAMEELLRELLGAVQALGDRMSAIEAAMAPSEVEMMEEEEQAMAEDAKEEVAMSELAEVIGKLVERVEKSEKAVVALAESRGLLTAEPGNAGAEPEPAPATVADWQTKLRKEGITGGRAIALAMEKIRQ